MVPEKRLELSWISPQVPETCASTISPLGHNYIVHHFTNKFQSIIMLYLMFPLYLKSFKQINFIK